jgi:hypothetical protein
MSAQIDDGGPAFPNNDAHGCAYAGMTLRDWFAGQTLAGEFVQSEYAGHYPNECPQRTLEERAQLLYRMADAMIEARKGVAR